MHQNNNILSLRRIPTRTRERMKEFKEQTKAIALNPQQSFYYLQKRETYELLVF
jgi:hypothetical protein